MTGTLDTRAKHIFGEALELSGAQRDLLLDAACGDDAELRARVRSLLAAASRDDRFLCATADGTGAARVDSGEAAGDVVGPYRLVEKVGEGGFGNVFRADQERPVRRTVALKILKLGMDTRAVIARFEQERQALALMDHPGIARVIDAGATARGRPFFVMDYVRGEPITAYVQRRALSIPERIRLFVDVCVAIQHAHTKGIIHRDIKPSNILVSESGEAAQAHVHVIDFGIAKAAAQSLIERTMHTAEHQPMGTPAYMSPEQAEGSPDIDTRTDVYSLGVVLYELLTGSTPFDRDILVSASVVELQRLIRETDPPTPSKKLSDTRAASPDGRSGDRRASTLRGDLDWITMRAIEKDRSRRYDSAAGLAGDLRRYLEGKTVSAAPPSRAYRARKFVRRHRVLVGAAALVALALIAGTIGTTVGLFRAQAAGVEALAQAKVAREASAEAQTQAKAAQAATAEALIQAHVADSVNALFTTTIERANRARENGRADLTVREVMDAAAKELIEHPGVQDPKVEYALANTIGDTYRELSLHEQAETIRRLAVERSVQAFGEESLEHGDALARLAPTLRSRGKQEEAAPLFARAHEIFVHNGVAGERHLADLAVDESMLDMDGNRFDRAEQELRAAIDWFETNNLTTTREYFAAQHNLAGNYYRQGQAAKAVPILKHIYDRECTLFGENDERCLETLDALATVQYAAGDPSAEGTFRSQLAIERRLRGGDHDSVATLLNSLGVILTRSNKPEEAEPYFRESAEMTKRLLGPEHSNTLTRVSAHAGCLMELGHDAEAESELREVLPLMVKPRPAGDEIGHGPAGPDTLLATYLLATLIERRNAPAEAEAVILPRLEAADAAIKDGERYEWLRRVLASVLGATIADQAADESLAREQRLSRLSEAEKLEVPATERLLAIAPTMGARNRSRMIPAAIDRVVRLYTLENEIEPSAEHEKALADWRARRDAFTPSGAPPAQTPKPS